MGKDVPTWWFKEAPNTNPAPTYPRPEMPKVATPRPLSKEDELIQALVRIEEKLDFIIKHSDFI